MPKRQRRGNLGLGQLQAKGGLWGGREEPTHTNPLLCVICGKLLIGLRSGVPDLGVHALTVTHHLALSYFTSLSLSFVIWNMRHNPFLENRYMKMSEWVYLAQYLEQTNPLIHVNLILFLSCSLFPEVSTSKMGHELCLSPPSTCIGDPKRN